MFKSKLRALVIPQSEHLRVAGTRAMLWSNEAFYSPPIERSVMSLGRRELNSSSLPCQTSFQPGSQNLDPKSKTFVCIRFGEIVGESDQTGIIVW